MSFALQAQMAAELIGQEVVDGRGREQGDEPLFEAAGHFHAGR